MKQIYDKSGKVHAEQENFKIYDEILLALKKREKNIQSFS